MSADIEIWKAGASQAFVRRFAIVRRIEVSGTTSASSGAAPAVAWAGVVAARSTSSATTRPSGPVPIRLRQVDSALSGDPAGKRRGLDTAVHARGLLGSGLRLVVGRGFSAALPLRLPRGAGRAFLLWVLVDLLGSFVRFGNVLALLPDHGDPLADLDLLTLLGEDLEKRSARVGLDLLGHLVGVELVERFALLDGVALGLQPADDRPGFHALAQPRKCLFSRQVAPPLTQGLSLLGRRYDPLRPTVRMIAS